MSLSHLLIEDAVRAALKEDLGHGHDITTQSIVPPSATVRAVLNSRENGKLAGLVVALSSFMMVDPDFDIEIHAQDGDDIDAGQAVAVIEGPAAALLTAERTALNFISHLSGVATLTHQYVQAIEGTDAVICDSRKTLPGLRAFQKYAVTMGGGMNHRHGLDDAVLIKDNHIALAGSIGEALNRALSNAGHMVKVEIEVDTLEQLGEVLEHGGADIVMLDNFKTADLKKAVQLVDNQMIIEASGGVTLETVKAIADTGVDLISVGALTHSARALDMGLDIETAE